jgi:DNA-binding LacI/PurR family transcriptional regulator
MAQMAIDLLSRAMDGEEIPVENHLMPTVLIERASCGPVTAEAAAPEGGRRL